MLRFFRSIRQQLLAENKTVKYVKYAVGEFLLIVAGILVALQIQNWNEGRLDRIEEREILIRIYDEIEAQVKRFDFFMPVIEIRGNAIDQVARTFRDERVEKHVEFLNHVITASLFGWSAIKHRSTTFDEIVSSGKLGLIQNVKLREKITYYYYEASIQNEVLDSRSTGFSQLSYLLIPRSPEGGDTELNDDLSPQDYEAIVSSVLHSELDKYIIGVQNQHYLIVNELKRMSKASSDLQAAIQVELDN